MSMKYYDAVPKHVRAVAADGKKLPRGLKWSGPGSPPVPGDVVLAKVNGIGECRVLRYFGEHGWLGLEVQPLQPPDWYVKQNGGNCPCHIFGAEVARVPA